MEKVSRRGFLNFAKQLFMGTVGGAIGGAVVYSLLNNQPSQTTQIITRTATETAPAATIEKTERLISTVTEAVTRDLPEKDMEVGGKTFKYWENPDADTAIFFLGGGELDKETGSRITIYPFEHVKSEFLKERKTFLNTLYDKGFSVITNQSQLTYNGKETFIKDVSEWLSASTDEKHKVYKNKILAGYSGSGAIVAYYLTTGENDFGAGIIMSGPIDGDEGYNGVFHRLALSAQYVRVPIELVYGKLDPKTSFNVQAKTFMALLPDEIKEKSKLYELPGIGHEIWKDLKSVIDDTLECLKFWGYMK